MVNQGSFRQDLFFRLQVVNINLPPLRERKADIPALVQFLLQRSAARFGVAVPTLAQGELHSLLHRPWPGNIRQLQNVLEEALICSGGRPLRLTADSAAPEPEAARPECRAASAVPGALCAPTQSQADASYDDVLRQYFSRLLESAGDRISGPHGAAVRAGLKPGTFRFKCKQLGLLAAKKR